MPDKVTWHSLQIHLNSDCSVWVIMVWHLSPSELAQTAIFLNCVLEVTSRPGHRLYWIWSFMVFLSPSTHILVQYLELNLVVCQHIYVRNSQFFHVLRSWDHLQFDDYTVVTIISLASGKRSSVDMKAETQSLRICDDGTLIQVLCFWTSSIVLFLFKNNFFFSK
jgi:hypothetical protein